MDNTWCNVTVEEVKDLEPAIAKVVSGWFIDQPLDAEDFLDRLESQARVKLGESMDDPTVKAALKIARRIRREILT